jgi:hypothetical protein
MDRYAKLHCLLENKKKIKLLFVSPNYGEKYKYGKLDLSYFNTNLFECNDIYITNDDIDSTIEFIKNNNYDCVVNECDGYIDNKDNIPNINFIRKLEQNGIPYVGSNERVFCLTKNDLRSIQNTPKTCTVTEYKNDNTLIPFPIFVKPNNLGCSELIDMDSVVYNNDQLEKQLEKVLKFNNDILLQEYLDGNEYTAVVFKDRYGEVRCLGPVQILFINPNIKYFTKKIKESDETEHYYNFNIENKNELNEICVNVYKDLNLNSYVRMDMRNKYVVDVNCYNEMLCDVEYEEMADSLITKYYNFNDFMIDMLYDACNNHK